MAANLKIINKHIGMTHGKYTFSEFNFHTHQQSIPMDLHDDLIHKHPMHSSIQLQLDHHVPYEVHRNSS